MQIRLNTASCLYNIIIFGVTQAYLEDNRSKEFIDPNHMAVTLYDLYPEYRKKLFKVRA